MEASHLTWNVDCWLCGEKLGSNKVNCMQLGRTKKCKYPPCEWAHTDDKIVRLCVARATEKKEKERLDQEMLAETKKKFVNGEIDFSEPSLASGKEQEKDADVSSIRLQESRARLLAAEARSLAACDMPPTSHPPAFPDIPNCFAPAPLPTKGGLKKKVAGDADKEDDGSKKTKWSTTTRTMLYRAIQKYDPFNHADKASIWDNIAQKLFESTEKLEHNEDGDFRVYSNGKTLSVYYARARDKQKKEEASEGHSGHAGSACENPARAEERKQLSGCIEAERSAKEGLERKREAKSGYEELRKGEVNDMIINLASQHDNIKRKAVTILASKLRAAKMKKIAFEQTNKDGKYTYSADDLANVEFWKKMKTMDATLPDDPTEGECTVEKKGGAMAVAILSLTEQLSAKQVQPMNAGDFANAFYAAKRAHEAAGTFSLKDKLARVDADVVEKIISSGKGEELKNKIIDAHYLI